MLELDMSDKEQLRKIHERLLSNIKLSIDAKNGFSADLEAVEGFSRADLAHILTSSFVEFHRGTDSSHLVSFFIHHRSIIHEVRIKVKHFIPYPYDL